MVVTRLKWTHDRRTVQCWQPSGERTVETTVRYCAPTARWDGGCTRGEIRRRTSSHSCRKNITTNKTAAQQLIRAWVIQFIPVGRPALYVIYGWNKGTPLVGLPWILCLRVTSIIGSWTLEYEMFFLVRRMETIDNT